MKDKVLQLRDGYLNRLELSGLTDSKREDADLKKQAKKFLEELKSICPHDDIVVLRSEYEGSHMYDYDDEHPEYRICLCCGIEESCYDNKFKLLRPKPIARFEGKYPIQIGKPLNFILKEAQELAKTKGYHYFGKER